MRKSSCFLWSTLELSSASLKEGRARNVVTVATSLGLWTRGLVRSNLLGAVLGQLSAVTQIGGICTAKSLSRFRFRDPKLSYSHLRTLLISDQHRHSMERMRVSSPGMPNHCFRIQSPRQTTVFRRRASHVKRVRNVAQPKSGDSPGSAPEDLGGGNRASSPLTASADGQQQILKPPSTLTGPAPAGNGTDTGKDDRRDAVQQGSAPEDVAAELAIPGAKFDSLAEASGITAESVGFRIRTLLFGINQPADQLSLSAPSAEVVSRS